MIRITKKCGICNHVMFWKLHQFHCTYCKIKVDFESDRLASVIEASTMHAQHMVTVPEGVDA